MSDQYLGEIRVFGGSSARLAECNKDCPVDSAIIGVIDEIARQSRGRLVLRSRKGEGTVAEIWLPIADADAVRVAEPDPDAVHSGRTSGSLTVLVVQLVNFP